MASKQPKPALRSTKTVRKGGTVTIDKDGLATESRKQEGKSDVDTDPTPRSPAKN